MSPSAPPTPAGCCVGNHDFDDGVDALRDAAAMLSFPLLCANLDDVGLAPSTLVEIEAGPLGVIGYPRAPRSGARVVPLPHPGRLAVRTAG